MWLPAFWLQAEVEDVGGDAYRMRAANHPTEEARTCHKMQTRLGSLGEVFENLVHRRAKIRKLA